MGRKTLLSFLLFAFGPGVLFASELGAIAPSGWHPDLSQAIRRADNDLQNAKAQQAMNMVSRDIADMKDSALFVVYIRLYERLSPKETIQLYREQEKWLKARQKYAADAISDPGGTLAPVEANMAEAEFTQKRIDELTKHLAALSPKVRK